MSGANRNYWTVWRGKENDGRGGDDLYLKPVEEETIREYMGEG